MTIDELVNDRRLRVTLEPVVSVRQKSVVGLVSRITNESGFVGPENRQGAAKQNLAVEFDRWYRTASLNAFKSAGAPGLLFLGFDTAVLDLGVAGSGHLAGAVKESGLAPSNIAISIRESKVEDPGLLSDFVARHRQQGFLIALKDLGTGHSNLTRVTSLRPDVLIIGEALVNGLENEFYSQEILKSLASLSKKIGALLLAENVSTESQALTALDLGVDMMEGRFFSADVDPNRAASDLADRHRVASIEKSKTLKKKARDAEQWLTSYVRSLTGRDKSGFDPILKQLIDGNPGVECAFILNDAGIQESETHTRPGVPFKKNALFHPARPGADHSAKEYVYLLADSFVNRFRSDPYVSQASGNLCVTLSALFRDGDNLSHILCLDLPWGQ